MRCFTRYKSTNQPLQICIVRSRIIISGHLLPRSPSKRNCIYVSNCRIYQGGYSYNLTQNKWHKSLLAFIITSIKK